MSTVLAGRTAPRPHAAQQAPDRGAQHRSRQRYPEMAESDVPGIVHAARKMQHGDTDEASKQARAGADNA